MPAMDITEQQLKMFSCNQQYEPAIHAAVSLAKKTLNWYYSLMDSSEVYCIAMVLHPHHKLEYFKSSDWKQEWIEMAEKLVHEEFTCSYLADDNSADIKIVDKHIKPKNMSSNMFDNICLHFLPPRMSKLQSEIDHYLVANIEEADDAIYWWYEQHVTYPKLSQMAIDYFIIPATSVNVE